MDKLFKWALIGVCVAMAFYFLAPEPDPHRDVRSAAESAVRATMKDPAAARFEGTHVVAEGRYVCGRVNGKNSFGAYIGMRRFIYNGRDVYLDDGNSLVRQLIDEHCGLRRL